MKTDKMIRLRRTTWRRLRKAFPALRGETACDYVDRLSREISNLTNERGLLL